MRRIAVFLFAILLLAIARPLSFKRSEKAVTNPPRLEERIESSTVLKGERAPSSAPSAKVAAHSLPKSSVVPNDIQAEMEHIGADWDKAREELYARFNLSEEQQAHIQEARAINAKTVDVLAKNLSAAADPEERNRLVAKIVETGFYYDRAMTEILGEKNFASLESLRDTYNEYLDNHSSLRPRLAHRW